MGYTDKLRLKIPAVGYTDKLRLKIPAVGYTDKLRLKIRPCVSRKVDYTPKVDYLHPKLLHLIQSLSVVNLILLLNKSLVIDI